jgi:hypothetical protein
MEKWKEEKNRERERKKPKKQGKEKKPGKEEKKKGLVRYTKHRRKFCVNEKQDSVIRTCFNFAQHSSESYFELKKLISVPLKSGEVKTLLYEKNTIEK